MKIAFHMDQICVRGTSVSTFSYMQYNISLLGNESILIVPISSVKKNDPLGVANFASKFSIFVYKDLTDMDRILEEEKCSLLYCIKYGKNDGVVSKKVKTVIHCVFDMTEPHGDVYAGVSSTLAKKFNSTTFVPHMVSLNPSKTKENLREVLKIPDNAIVFGRFGGEDTFNLPFCWQAIYELINERKDLYFIFINTPHIIQNHPQVLYLNKITSEEDKNRFICTCDAHLECGTLGHTFGINLSEFSVNNKPLIVYKSPTLWNTAHLEILGDKGIYFTNKEEFKNILNSFHPADYRDKDLNCYRDYTPEKVMAIFKKVFID